MRNSKHTSSNSLTPLGTQNKDLGATSQTSAETDNTPDITQTLLKRKYRQTHFRMEHRSLLFKTHLNNAIGFPNNYPLDSDLSSGYG